MSILGNAIRGFAMGALATVPMTGEFLAARRLGFVDEVPPHKAIRSTTRRLREPNVSVVSGAAHLLVGGGAGAIYAVAVPEGFRGAISGTLFGLAVWFVGYEGIMPVATDIAPAHRDRRDRAATIFVAHIIYGAALGLMTRGRRSTTSGPRSS